MKKTYIFKAIMMMCLMLVGAMSFTACSEDDDLVTDQYAGGPVKLLAYGPNPVARMGELRILGVGLDQVQSVTIPGAGDITDINHISKEEIRITVPNEAVIGKIVLNTAVGQIESVTALKYTEPVGFDEVGSLNPGTVKAGQTLTIKGEYLNLVHSVIFAENVEVDEFASHSRKEISLVVPAEAQTGKIAISFCATGDTIPNLIYSQDVLNVVLPAVKEVANLTGKKPGDEIKQAGTDLDLVEHVTVAGQEVEFKVVDSNLVYVLPANTPAEAEVAVYPASGVKVVVAYIGMIVPTELVATPATGLRDGSTITITGKDLDVVADVTFPGVDAAVAPKELTATKLVVTAPAGFVSGDLVLNCKSGATQRVAIETLKPTFESYSVEPAPANKELTINGHDLDLVAKVQFSGTDAVEVATSVVAINVVVPAKAESGPVVLIMGNGEQVEIKALEVSKPECAYVPDESVLISTDEKEIHAGDIVIMEVENADKLTGVQVDGQDCQYILKENMLYVLTPDNAGMSSKLTLISSNGEISYPLCVLPNSEVVTVFWEGAELMDWGNNQPYIGSDMSPEFIAAGGKPGCFIRVYITPTSDAWRLQIFEGHWGPQLFDISGDGNEGSTVVDLSAGYFEFEVTQEMYDMFIKQQWWGGTFVIQGQFCIVTKFAVVEKFSSETVLWEGELIADDWGNQPYALSDAGAELAEAGAKAGQTIRMYITPLDDIWQLEILEGHWGPWYCAFANQADDPKFTIWDLAEHKGAIEFKLTQEMLDAAYVQQWWGGVFVLNGDNVKVTKITIE